MAFQLTAKARRLADNVTKEPILVLQIDGVPTIYGTSPVLEYIRIGDTGLFIDGTWKIGGLREVDGNLDVISFGSGSDTTTKITQGLDPEKGRGSTTQNMSLALIDKDGEITRLISPGAVVEDVLARRAKVYLGWAQGGFKDDFIPLLKGTIDTISARAGVIKLTISNPEQKKAQDIFTKVQTKLNGSINSTATTITVDDTTGLLLPVYGPDGVTLDTSLVSYVRIDDEIIKFTGITGNDLTGCVRGQLGTANVSHADEAEVNSFYRLVGNGMDLALKLMLSMEDYFVTGVDVTHVNFLSPTEHFDNALFFDGIDLEEEYGLVVGDYATTAGFANGANNFTAKQITAVTKTNLGSFVVIDGVTLVDEPSAAGTVSFRSQWDSLPLGASCQMVPDDVDVARHLDLKRLYLSNYDLDLYIYDTINAKDFIEQEIYMVASASSLPRKARASVGITTGPIPSVDTVVLDDTSVTNPSKLAVIRQQGKYFYNSVVVKFDSDPLDDTNFLRGVVYYANDSKNRIKVGNRTLTVESKGLRTALGAENLATSFSDRRLKRYKFAAEYLEGVEVQYRVGYNIEVNDVVVFDGTLLHLPDSKTAQRGMQPRLMEVLNKTLDLKSGKVSLHLIDTAMDVQTRYGLIAIASRVRSVVSASKLQIENIGLYSIFGSNEGAKWSRYKRPVVRVHNEDYTDNESATILSVTGNIITLDHALAIPVAEGYFVEVDVYNNETDQEKLMYASMRDVGPFDDGKTLFKMI